MAMPKILIILGSKSDLPYFEKSKELLRDLNLDYTLKFFSAHRTHNRLSEFIKNLDADIEVIITAAGSANHLSGAVAALTTLPVIGVPLPTSDLKGLDALLSTVQMPKGFPVGVMALGETGLYNAVIFSAQILQLKHPIIKEKLQKLREKMEAEYMST